MPPTTQNHRRRDGRADRRQIQALTLTAQCLRRRRGLRRRFWPRAPCNRPPLFIISATPRRVHARQRVAAVFARESECAKAAILRSRWKFHGNRYHEAARFVTETSGVSRKFRSMELLPVHAIHPLFTSSSIFPTCRFARRRQRKSFAATPAIVVTARPRSCCVASKALRRWKRPARPARPFTCARGSRRSP